MSRQLLIEADKDNSRSNLVLRKVTVARRGFLFQNLGLLVVGGGRGFSAKPKTR